MATSSSSPTVLHLGEESSPRHHRATVFSQLSTLLWKQRVNLRADWPSLLVTILLPSVLLYLSSTNSGSVAQTDSLDLKECKIDNFLYCNYPMTFVADEQYSDEFYNPNSTISTTFLEAAANVAKSLGTDIDNIIGDNSLSDPKLKNGGEIKVLSSELASVTWYNGRNDAFAQHFVNIFNTELSSVGNPIRFQEAENPYAYEGGSSFDLRIGSFLLLLQVVSTQITTEKSTNMYYYYARSGLLPSVFWAFQYLYWMVIASVTIGVTAIFGVIFDSPIAIGPYFVSAWWHIAVAVLVGSVFGDKKYVNIISIFLLILGFAIPIVFTLSLPQTKANEEMYNGLSCIPLFFAMNDDSVTSFQLRTGCIISAGLMVLAAYLAPLLTVNDGMFAGSKINFAYFLTSGFWKEGIVALPSYQKSQRDGDDEGELPGVASSSSLRFVDCVKRFGEEKVIGPMNINLKIGNIATLLGPNGVGKSTLLKVAAGYYIPSGGEMMLGDRNTFRESPHSCLTSISFCPQDNYLYENMTVEENLLLMSSFRDMSKIDTVESHIDWILDTLNILDKKSTLAKNLSGGMKRRLCLAVAILGFPPVILCDEPSSGVDSINQRGIWKLLEAAKKHSAILLTSHSALETVILSDSVVMMESSENISQTTGVQGIAYSVKDDKDLITTEYEVNSTNLGDIARVIESLPNDGSEWKVASKRLTVQPTLPPLTEALEQSNKISEDTEEPSVNETNDSQPDTSECEAPSTLRQIKILMSLVLIHPDRVFFLLFFAGPLNGAQLWLMTAFDGFNETTKIILTPMVPLISIFSSSIVVVQLAEIFATERSLGVLRLILGQGISRFSYLTSSVLLYTMMAYPVSVAFLIGVGSANGTSTGLFALFVIYSSFIFLLVGVSAAFGAVFDRGTAFIATLVFPSVCAIFAQGSINQTFANLYPGAVGQVMAGLLIDDVSKGEWTLFVVSIVLNIAIGAFSFYIFMVRLGNYNPFRSIFGKKSNCIQEGEEVEEIAREVDVESNNTGRKNGTVLLEGQNIIKTYGVGQNDTASFHALSNVTFIVNEGELLGLVGKSGAGKSTLMDILAGQLTLTSGDVFVEGNRVVPSDIAKVVSVCGQIDTIWPDLKVIRAISIFMLCRGYRGTNLYCSNKISDPYISHLVKKLGLEEVLNKPFKKLSGGQKRKLAFLVSLMGSTKVVLVDEAMTGVDINTRQIMWKILQDEVRLRSRSVVVTSHDLSEVEQYCNTIGILHNGQLIEMGQLETIKKKWSDSIKLICLFSSTDTADAVQRIIIQNQPNIVVKEPHIDILDGDGRKRNVCTYEIDLVDLSNIAGLVETIDDAKKNDSSILYWSIEPQSLDDFVRSKSQVVQST